MFQKKRSHLTVKNYSTYLRRIFACEFINDKHSKQILGPIWTKLKLPFNKFWNFCDNGWVLFAFCDNFFISSQMHLHLPRFSRLYEILRLFWTFKKKLINIFVTSPDVKFIFIGNWDFILKEKCVANQSFKVLIIIWHCFLVTSLLTQGYQSIYLSSVI